MNELGWLVLEGAARATALALIGLLAVMTLRRRGPSAGALAGSTTLAVLVGVTALAVSPWPCWLSSSDEAKPARAITPSTRALAGPDGLPDQVRPTPAPVTRVLPASAEVRPGWSDLLREFERELADSRDHSSASNWRWTAWAALAFLVGLAVALVRLGLGLWAVRSLRARSRAVDDPALIAMAASLRAEMGLRREVELRESTELATPATVGWLRASVLLPEGWEAWDGAEQRAVLAHELAHVLRGDYLSGLLAQFSLALHFYHPLIHALARRVRLEQELAADAWGARLSGGRRPYLTALANLALRQDPRPAAWPARPFLPPRGTFLRRIEMLRDPKALQSKPMRPTGRALTVAALTLAGLMVAGFRGPVGSPRALAQEPTTPKGSGPSLPPLEVTSSSSDVRLAMEIRPSSMLKTPEFKKLADLVASFDPDVPKFVTSGDMEQVILLGFERDGFPMAYFLRSVRPYDWKTLMGPEPKEVQADGFTYFREGLAQSQVCFRILDDRTLAIGTEGDVTLPPLGGFSPKRRHAWDDAWKKLPVSPVRATFDTSWAARLMKAAPPKARPGALSVETLLLPFLEKAQAVAVSLDAPDALDLQVLATSGSEEAAGRVADTFRAYLTLARNAIPDLRRSAEKTPPAMARPAVELVDVVEAMLGTAKVEPEKSDVKVYLKADAAALATASKIVAPMLAASREAAGRSVCVNHLKQLALAMHNYHATHNVFPPAVLLGPDGTTPHSWRVALLPFLGFNELYQQYKFDEPWDGPNNIKLLAKMPALFACPSDPGALAGHRSSYHVLSGPDSIFPPDGKGMAINHITDGTSNTILVVEANQPVPWTKPEDIPCDKELPLPDLGGFHPGGCNVAFADGSVRFLKATVHPLVLRALFSRAGGEVIANDAF